MQHILDIACRLTQGKGRVVYLTTFGSHLYGTATPQSDYDYKGLFLPSVRSLMLGHHCHSVQYSSGDAFSKNTAGDVDVQLWTVQYWLELLRKGDTNAIDLLYSMQASHVQRYDVLHLYEQYALVELIDLKNTKAYASYAYQQARKYGLKGSRMGLLKDLVAWVEHSPDVAGTLRRDGRAGEVFDALLREFYDPSYCFRKDTEAEPMLYILGKGYGASIRMSEMCRRLHAEFDKYGERVRQAEQNQGIDWKALSHAVRCLRQMQELAATGNLRYPLECAPLLMDIKQGNRDWARVEALIVELLAQIDTQVAELEPNTQVLERHESLILQLYAAE